MKLFNRFFGKKQPALVVGDHVTKKDFPYVGVIEEIADKVYVRWSVNGWNYENEKSLTLHSQELWNFEIGGIVKENGSYFTKIGQVHAFHITGIEVRWNIGKYEVIKNKKSIDSI